MEKEKYYTMQITVAKLVSDQFGIIKTVNRIVDFYGQVDIDIVTGMVQFVVLNDLAKENKATFQCSNSL